MITDPVVQQQMQRMRQSQAEADAYGSRAMQSTASSQSPGQGFASGFLSQFDPAAFGKPKNAGQGIQAGTGQGMTMAKSDGGLGLNAPSTPFAQGIGAGIQAAMSDAQPAQTAGSVGLGTQAAKKIW